MKAVTVVFFLGLLGLTAISYAMPDARGDNAQLMVRKSPKERKIHEGKSFELTFEALNTGTKPWKRDYHYYALGVGNRGRLKQNPTGFRITKQHAPDVPDSDHNRIMLENTEVVGRGAKHLFRAEFSHDLKAGQILEIEARMVIEDGQADGWRDGWFGQSTIITLIVVR